MNKGVVTPVGKVHYALLNAYAKSWRLKRAGPGQGGKTPCRGWTRQTPGGIFASWKTNLSLPGQCPWLWTAAKAMTASRLTA